MAKQFISNLINVIPTIKTFKIQKSDICVTVPIIKIIPLLFFLQNHTHTQYKILSDLCVVDYPNRSNRFEVIYNLLSIKFNSRVKVKILVNELMGIPSITNIFINANWWEREAWDMFGIFFINHPDLRRILSDYGFEGHPLQKDFPLSGFSEVRYSEVKKRVVYEPTTISQEYRFYTFQNSWS